MLVSSRRGRLSFRGRALELSGELPDTGESEGLSLVIDHRLEDLKHIWVPHLTPTDRHVAGDFVFRSPAVILGTHDVALAFVIDVDDLERARNLHFWLDYDHPRRRLRIVAGNYEKEGHVFFVSRPALGLCQSVRLRVHVVASEHSRDLANPYAMAARFL